MTKFDFGTIPPNTYPGVLICFDENNKFIGYECYGHISKKMKDALFWTIGKNRIENLDWLYQWHSSHLRLPKFDVDYLYNLGIRCIKYYRSIMLDKEYVQFGMKYAGALELEREFKLNPHKLNLGVKEFMLWKVYG